MDKKRFIVIFAGLLIFSAVGYALKNLSKDSGDLLNELDRVVQAVNKKESNFYDTKKELENTKKEFAPGTSLEKYTSAIADTMKKITFEIKEDKEFMSFMPSEYFEWLKKENKKIDKDSLDFFRKALYICKDPTEWGSNPEFFEKALVKALKCKFRNNSNILSFVENKLKSMNYPILKKLSKTMSKELDEIFEEGEDYECFDCQGVVEFAPSDWAENKRDFCEDLAKSSETFAGYSVSGLSKNEYIDEKKVPSLYIPYKPKNNFYKLDNMREKLFRRYIVESIVFKKLFQAVSDILNIVNVEEYKIFIFPTSAKKTFPKKGDVFTLPHVNSAYNSEGSKLVIYHKEESLKTLLHELNHNINLVDGDEKDLNFKKGHFAIDHKDGADIAMFEVIVESMACITNVIMTAYETNPEKFLDVVTEMWEREKLFATYQAAKILYLNNFDNLEQFYKPQASLPRVWQETWAAEYHVLKAAVIQNINELLKIFMNEEYKDKKLRVQAIKKLVDTQIRDKEFEKKINGFIEAFKKGWISNKKTKKWELGRPDPANSLFETGRFSVIHPEF